MVFRSRTGFAWAGFARLAILALGAAALGGCASMSQSVADKMSTMPVVGLPENAPARPADPAVYPAVHDMPPPRNSVTLTSLEQRKLEADLVEARDRQQRAVGIPLAPRNEPKGKKSGKKGEAKASGSRPAPAEPADDADGSGVGGS